MKTRWLGAAVVVLGFGCIESAPQAGNVNNENNVQNNANNANNINNLNNINNINNVNNTNNVNNLNNANVVNPNNSGFDSFVVEWQFEGDWTEPSNGVYPIKLPEAALGRALNVEFGGAPIAEYSVVDNIVWVGFDDLPVAGEIEVSWPDGNSVAASSPWRSTYRGIYHFSDGLGNESNSGGAIEGMPDFADTPFGLGVIPGSRMELDTGIEVPEKDQTIEVWVKRTGTTEDVIYSAIEADSANGYQLVFAGGNLGLRIKDGPGDPTAVGDTPIDDEFHHIVVRTRYDNDVVAVFVDGERVLEGGVTEDWIAEFNQNAPFATPWQSPNALMDELRISNISRSGEYLRAQAQFGLAVVNGSSSAVTYVPEF